jgi:uncharacterized protein
MKIILFGGTGFIGNALRKELLTKGHEVFLFARSPRAISEKNLTVVQWELNKFDSLNYFDGADAIINLAGESIGAGRWTEKRKEKIIRSRIDTTAAIVKLISMAENKPGVLINASAVGYYGNVENSAVTESHSKGSGFLSDVCEKWESGAAEAEKYDVRVVLMRFGIVLEKDGGALCKMLLPFKLFFGGPLGSGSQWMPWVHRDDVVSSIIFVLENKKISGAVNVTAPNPVRMKEFAKILGRVLNRPSWFPVPAFILKIVLGEMSEMVLTGQKAIPEKLIREGYKFKFPELFGAVEEIFK